MTFAPCFLWIFLGAPYVEAIRGLRSIGAALAAITAAVVGVILNLAVWFAIHTFFAEVHPVRLPGLHLDLPVLASLRPWAVVLAIIAAAMIFRLKAGMIATLAVSAAGGIALFALGAI
jgi:chromate transporter